MELLHQLHRESSVFLFRQKAALSSASSSSSCSAGGETTRELADPVLFLARVTAFYLGEVADLITRLGAFETYDVQGNVPAVTESIHRNKVCLKVLDNSWLAAASG